MATPLGHGIVGIGIGYCRRDPGCSASVGWMIFCIFAAGLPDADFIAGMLAGDINRFHQGASHSLIAAIFFGAISARFGPLFGLSRVAMLLFGTVLFSSHLMLDLLTEDGRAPYGIPLLWPITDRHFDLPFDLLPGVRHGVPGDDLGTFVSELISLHNLTVIGMEILIGSVVFGAGLAIGWLRERFQNSHISY